MSSFQCDEHAQHMANGKADMLRIRYELLYLYYWQRLRTHGHMLTLTSSAERGVIR